jgi:hypothetical protein
MTETGKLKVGPSLEAMMERHIAAQLAIIGAVREWDGRQIDGEVSNVVYANALRDVLSVTNLGTIGKKNSN